MIHRSTFLGSCLLALLAGCAAPRLDPEVFVETRPGAVVGLMAGSMFWLRFSAEDAVTGVEVTLEQEDAPRTWRLDWHVQGEPARTPNKRLWVRESTGEHGVPKLEIEHRGQVTPVHGRWLNAEEGLVRLRADGGIELPSVK